MHSPLARHLVRFPAAVALAETLPPPAAAPLPAPAPPEPQVTMTVAEFEARLDGVRCDVAQAERASAERAVADLRRECEAAIAAASADAAASARAQWAANSAERVGAQVEGAFAKLREVISDGLAEALRPLLASALVERAVAELREALDRLLADPDAAPVVVRGPADFLAALAAACGPRGGLALQEDGDEIVVVADGARVETRLSAAFAALKGEAA